MLYATWHWRKWSDCILIDTFSTWSFYYAFAVGLMAKQLNIPYIPILHGGNLPSRLSRSPLISKLYFGNARNLVAPSAYIQSEFEDFGYKALIIPNFIFIQNYPFQGREYFEPKLLWVRSFHETYNPEMAIVVLNQLLETWPNASLCMVGPDKDGSLNKCKLLVEKLNLQENVTFTGLLSKDQWIEISKDYSIFINTTNYDNTPISLIEAMALGLAIVSTDAGGLPYLIENEKEGILTPKKDPDAMVLAIKSLIRNQSIAHAIAQNARKKAEGFDWNVVRKEWLSLLS